MMKIEDKNTSQFKQSLLKMDEGTREAKRAKT